MIALAPLSMALQTYFLLSEITLTEAEVYFHMLRYVAIPLVFGFLLWKRLIIIGKNYKLLTYFFVGFIAFSLLVPLLALNLNFNPTGTLTNEIAAWSKSGGKGDFSFSKNVKIKMTTFNAIVSAITYLPLLAALYFAVDGPRPPRGNQALVHLSRT